MGSGTGISIDMDNGAGVVPDYTWLQPWALALVRALTWTLDADTGLGSDLDSGVGKDFDLNADLDVVKGLHLKSSLSLHWSGPCTRLLPDTPPHWELKDLKYHGCLSLKHALKW